VCVLRDCTCAEASSLNLIQYRRRDAAVAERMLYQALRRGTRAPVDQISAHVLAAERLHGDDTPAPVLAKGETDTCRPLHQVRDVDLP
jgi:hypothetical protein